ncbi:hypothetical protein D3C72_1804860 [compost metagenome]
MISQVAPVASPSQGAMPTSTPAAVATPLPPWKLKNTGYRWPRKAARPASAATPSPSPHCAPNWRIRNTGSQPFAASSSKVASAAPLLPERSTLVAPGLPLP